MAAVEPAWWAEQGYMAGRQLDESLWLCVHKMIFTWRLMLCTERQVLDFACYHTPAEALLAWALWDGRSEPPGEWVRHHGSGKRRLEDGSIVVAP